VDLDHCFEYLKARRRWVSIRDFFYFWRHFQETRIYLFIHSTELIFLFAIAALKGLAPEVTGGLAFGLLHHLILDQWGNGIRPGGYLLIMRMAWKFKSERIFRDWQIASIMKQ